MTDAPKWAVIHGASAAGRVSPPAVPRPATLEPLRRLFAGTAERILAAAAAAGNRVIVITLWCALLAAVPAHAQTVEIPGAGPPRHLLLALAHAFNQRHAPARVEVPRSTGTSGALDAVRGGRSVLARLPRRLTAEEERGGLRQTVIAREAIVFATGAQVTVSNVSSDQLAGIFSGRIADWHGVGGAPAPIRVFYREETADTLRIIRARLPEFAKLRFAEKGRSLNFDYEVMEALERFGWGVGWGAAGNLRAAKNLRVLSLNGVTPGTDSLRSGKYPLHYEAVLIYRQDEPRGIAKQFVEFCLSPEGRRVIESFGALPPAGI
jgi:phosphate transport system substrate-binding protein